MVGDMIAPLAMIYIGAVLGRMPLREMIYDRWAYVISFIRLIVVPLTAYLILRPFITDQLVLGVVIVGLSTPRMVRRRLVRSDIFLRSKQNTSFLCHIS